MSNKRNGTAFEKEFAQLLSEEGFWAHCLKDNANGQPFDVIAAKGGRSYVFDCKDCQTDRFVLSRIEENQHHAMKLWAATGNQQGMFVIRFSGRIYLVPHRMLEILQENGTKSITEIETRRYGRTFEQWCYSQHRLDKAVAR
ncbi:Holliday junction resolvase RecU [Sellimonas intestinalis]|uniref:Holliday junction resolvase RecU n=1 Tax=Sellimonas intestinalis TaxID=1653434 RepID=UPI0015EBECE4|nr:Holliday junction resolvase RecU [Sellimonas intestinalis]MBA2215221.1 Holliday junction resolvase RecU [Sellimonas intestinalis]